MKKEIRAVLMAVLVICLWFGGVCHAEGNSKRLELAFGLFSVEVPADAVIGPNTGNELSDFRYEVSTFPKLVYANFAPIAEYGHSAQRKLNNYISLMYSLCGEGYSESEITEETLPGGIRLRWQLMKGHSAHALWFEAFSEKFGYNICLYGAPEEEQNLRMLALMRSFQVDPERELDLTQIRQEERADGTFVSAEHGLCIQLDPSWNAVDMADLLLPETAFMLQKDEGQWLIQIVRINPVPADKSRDLLVWFVQNMRKTDPFGNTPVFGEPYSITLRGLGGIEAWIMDEETDIYVKSIAFVHESYGYYGSLMWVKELDGVARPWMDAAIQSLTIPK